MKSLEIPVTTRITCTLPVDTVSVVDHIAERIGCTRSAVISHLLSSSSNDVAEVVDSVLPKRRGKSLVSRRASGRSVEELGAIFEDLEQRLKERDLASRVALDIDFDLIQEQDG